MRLFYECIRSLIIFYILFFPCCATNWLKLPLVESGKQKRHITETEKRGTNGGGGTSAMVKACYIQVQENKIMPLEIIGSLCSVPRPSRDHSWMSKVQSQCASNLSSRPTSVYLTLAGIRWESNLSSRPTSVHLTLAGIR